MAKQESSSSATDKSSMSNLNIMYLVGGVIGFLIIIKLLKILIKWDSKYWNCISMDLLH